MSTRLYFVPGVAVVQENGETHTHTVVGPVETKEADERGLEQWFGFSSKRPIDCPDCLDMLEVFYQAQCDKYGWSREDYHV